jgi:hypothetical protein
MYREDLDFDTLKKAEKIWQEPPIWTANGGMLWGPDRPNKSDGLRICFQQTAKVHKNSDVGDPHK